MAASPAFQFYPQDFLVGTADMSAEEVGGYIRLLCYQWAKGGIPDDDVKIGNLAGCPKTALPAIRQKFVVGDDGMLRNERMELVRSNQDAYRNRQASNGSERWAGKKRAERLAEARKRGRHSADQWQALVTYCGRKCVKCGASGELVKDHITPIYQGGSDGIENIQPLCVRCNSSKGPDTTDHRPTGWKDACQTPARCLPDACSSPSSSSSHPLSRPRAGKDFSSMKKYKQLVAAIRSVASSDQAAPLHQAIADAIRQFGEVLWNFPTPDRGDGRTGKVDLVLRTPDEDVAIEIDRLSPRIKSVEKLLSLPCYRIVVLRNGSDRKPPKGIDAVIGLGIPTGSSMSQSKDRAEAAAAAESQFGLEKTRKLLDSLKGNGR